MCVETVVPAIHGTELARPELEVGVVGSSDAGRPASSARLLRESGIDDPGNCSLPTPRT
jgi:hypothetical protein